MVCSRSGAIRIIKSVKHSSLCFIRVPYYTFVFPSELYKIVTFLFTE